MPKKSAPAKPNEVGPVIAVRDHEALKDEVSRVKGQISALGKRSTNDVVVVTTPTEKQLWVKPSYRDYRKAWLEAFGEESIPVGYHIDHIHNADRAVKEQWGFVRLACIPGVDNCRAAGVHEGKNTELFVVNLALRKQTINFAQWSKLNTSGKLGNFD